MMSLRVLCRTCALQRFLLQNSCRKAYHQTLIQRLSHSYLGKTKTTSSRSFLTISSIKLCDPQTTILPQRYYSNDVNSDDEIESNQFEELDIELDWNYLSSPENITSIKQNVEDRKGVGDIDKFHHLLKKMMAIETTNEEGCYTVGHNVDLTPADFLQIKRRDHSALEQELWETALAIPNKTHPDVLTDPESEGKVLSSHGTPTEFDFEPRSVIELGEHLNGLRVRDLSAVTGSRSYFLMGPLALMEQALVKYSTDLLRQRGFKLMSVPNLIYPEIIEGCGFKTTGERNQIYRLDPHLYGDVCLAGTGEMSLAGFVMNHGFTWEELPQKIMTVSRCYRAETSEVEEEKGIYRVHQFTKVEMFSVTSDDQGHESQTMMDHFLDIQKELYSSLGLCMRILDMPAHELGAPAYRKYDVEAWMPHKQFWGEISSTSNCTDYQSRRLDIRYWDKAGNLRHCHTVNGTACAVPRLIMAILETYQQKDMSVKIPKVLQPYMDNQELLVPSEKVEMKPIKLNRFLKERLKSQ